jgi:ATP-binding cassette subfamily F protein 3
MALITHDRHLIRAIATKIVHVEGGKATVYDGDYDYFLWKRAQNEAAAAKAEAPAAAHAPHSESPAAPARPAGSGTAPKQSGPKTKEQKRAEAEARTRAYRSGKDERGRIGDVEAEVAKVQTTHDALLARLAEPDLYANKAAFDAAMAEYGTVKARLAALEREWLELSQVVESLDPDGTPVSSQVPAHDRAPKRRHKA